MAWRNCSGFLRFRKERYNLCMQPVRVLITGLLVLILLAVPAPVQAQDCFEDTYVIQPGDSLYSIAVECDVPYAALVGINVEISNPDRIYPGQVIRLVASVPLTRPSASGPTDDAGLQEGGGTYIVRSGDSLARIAYLYNTTIDELRAANPEIGPGNTIHPGQVLRMPPGAKTEKGWVGVNTRIAAPGDEIEIRVVDFPPYTTIELRIAEFSIFGELFVYEYYEAVTDAVGSAWVRLEMPFYAWYDEEWVVEVVAGSEIDPETGDEIVAARAISPLILIDYY